MWTYVKYQTVLHRNLLRKNFNSFSAKLFVLLVQFPTNGKFRQKVTLTRKFYFENLATHAMKMHKIQNLMTYNDNNDNDNNVFFSVPFLLWSTRPIT